MLGSTWDLPRLGIKPVSPALAGGFFTTEPPGTIAKSPHTTCLTGLLWSRKLFPLVASSPSSVQFSSVAQLCPTLCDHMNRSMRGLTVHHKLLEFIQTHVHWVSDAIQPSHPLSSPSPPALNTSQHQGLFQWVNCSHEVAKVLEFQLQHQSYWWTTRTDFLYDGLVGSPISNYLS